MTQGHELPLTGVRVLDFSWAIVGGVSAKILGDYGAEVWKVESASRLSQERAGSVIASSDPRDPNDRPWFAHMNTSKRSITVNLKDPRGVGIVRDLARKADVILENFSPGTIARMGFDWASISAENPRLIMVSGSIFGQSGLLSSLPGTDASGSARSSRMYMTGYSDGGPLLPSIPYGDPMVPCFLVSTVIAALERRDRDGKGCRIDAAMLEILCQQMFGFLNEAERAGANATRLGNRHPWAAPHGIFACASGRWIAVEVFTDDEWQRFAAVVGGEPLASDDRFTGAVSRKQHEDELDRLIEERLAKRDGAALMDELQAVGVGAGLVQSAGEIVDDDPQIAIRGLLQPLRHSRLGCFDHQTTPVAIGGLPRYIGPVPELGEHTMAICRDILKMTDQELALLETEGVLR